MYNVWRPEENAFANVKQNEVDIGNIYQMSALARDINPHLINPWQVLLPFEWFQIGINKKNV